MMHKLRAIGTSSTSAHSTILNSSTSESFGKTKERKATGMSPRNHPRATLISTGRREKKPSGVMLQEFMKTIVRHSTDQSLKNKVN